MPQGSVLGQSCSICTFYRRSVILLKRPTPIQFNYADDTVELEVITFLAMTLYLNTSKTKCCILCWEKQKSSTTPPVLENIRSGTKLVEIDSLDI